MVQTGNSAKRIASYRSLPLSIGKLSLGGNAPVRIQSMTTTDTNEVEASVEQCKRMIAAGAELVRLTTQGKREVQNLRLIRQKLRADGYLSPVVADIHFKADLALDAARVADKIRINPGNYLKDASLDEALSELITVCKEEECTLRIGVNHGSLNDSILQAYGDTPEGMAESAMQFLRICRQQDFHRIVVSLKSSNPRVTVQSVRLLVWKMIREDMAYPLHLGVTEAGDGPEGRIKSAVGMAPLLLEGMGDTLRVSLTEAPEHELPVARALAELFPKPKELPYSPFHSLAWDPFSFQQRTPGSLKIISPDPPDPGLDLRPESMLSRTLTLQAWEEDPDLLSSAHSFLLLERDQQALQEVKYRLNSFCRINKDTPVLYKTVHHTADSGRFSMQLAGELSFLLIDGIVDAVWVENTQMETNQVNEILLRILQAIGARITKTEYIACPSCGRTQFDIVSRLREIREATSHLPGLKIGVMGCIVNGPGEMADSHYGYVGAGPGKVSLYKGKTEVRKQIPESEALQALIQLMKVEGDWVDP